MTNGHLLVFSVATVPEPELMKRAREIAEALGHELFICCLLDDAALPPALPGRRERVLRIRKKLLTRCKNALESVLDEMNATGVVARGYVKTADSVTAAVLELVERKSPSLVMICRRPHTRFEEAILSGDDFAIIRSCPAPVWVVNPAKGPGDKIVGAVDRPEPQGNGASLDQEILENVSKLARKLGKENHALHTFGQAGLSRPIEHPTEDPDDDMGTSFYDRRMRRIIDFGEAHGVPREWVHIHEGKLVSALEEMSEPMNADLIVIGARSRGRLRRMLSGSAAERIVQRVKTDVLVLKDSQAAAAETGDIH
jgi:universal stress protein E